MKDITGIGNPTLQKIHDNQINAKRDIFASMNSPTDLADGKRLFLDRVNQSNAANLHPVDKDPAYQRELL